MGKTRYIHAHYEPRISPDRENYDILDWSDAASQEARFKALADNVPLAGRALLDVGCGLGDLLIYLERRGLPVEYTGVDIVEKMVQAARDQHPEARFVHADLFADDPFGDERFDVVFCSGIFNLDLGNNRQFLPAALARLVEFARGHLVFNLLHGRAHARHEHCVYYDPDEVISQLRHLAGDVRVVDDYLHNDFTVICRLDVAPPANQ